MGDLFFSQLNNLISTKMTGDQTFHLKKKIKCELNY